VAHRTLIQAYLAKKKECENKKLIALDLKLFLSELFKGIGFLLIGKNLTY